MADIFQERNDYRSANKTYTFLNKMCQLLFQRINVMSADMKEVSPSQSWVCCCDIKFSPLQMLENNWLFVLLCCCNRNLIEAQSSHHFKEFISRLLQFMPVLRKSVNHQKTALRQTLLERIEQFHLKLKVNQINLSTVTNSTREHPYQQRLTIGHRVRLPGSTRICQRQHILEHFP